MEKRLLRVQAYTSDKVACSWQRTLLPMHWMNKLGIAEVKLGEFEDEQGTHWADVMLFQRFYSGRPYAWFLELWRRGKRLVYEIDDDVWSITDDNPFKKFYDAHQLRAIEDMVRKAHLVTVPSAGLAEVVSEMNDNVAIIRNGVDPQVLELVQNANADELRICFSGSNTHHRDFKPLLNVLPGLCRRYPELRVVVIGGIPKGLKDALAAKNLHLTGWVPFEGSKLQPDVYTVMAACGIHIGIVPLVPNRFNNAKSDIKFAEYGAMGAAIVAAEVGIYKETIRHLENGLLVPGNEWQHWERLLRVLIEDKEMRKRLGEAAFQEVRKKYTYRTIAYQWAEALGSLVDGDQGREVSGSVNTAETA